VEQLESCPECGHSLDRANRRRFCSDRCATKYHRDADRDRRRAVAQGKAAERVFRRAVFDRDQWTCGLCGLAVDPLTRHPSRLSASLDHIVPLGRGGSHTYPNVQLAHLGCNIAKGPGRGMARSIQAESDHQTLQLLGVSFDFPFVWQREPDLHGLHRANRWRRDDRAS